MPVRQMCCAECFGDRGLRKSIIPSLKPNRGTCDFCKTENAGLIEPSLLRDVFELLTNIYQLDSSGRLLVEWLREDWGLFSHPRLDLHASKALLAEVLNDGEIVRQNFVPSPAYTSEELDSWAKLRNELMYRNRYFPEEPLHADRLAGLLDYLQADGLPLTWHRARIMTGGSAIPLAEMKAPPARLVSHGRANPPGIPYLYLGSSPETAIAEVRPHTGESACVAEFVVPADLKVVDLRNPRQLVSPFILSDEDEIGRLRVDIGFLEHLGEELTRPVLPQGAAIDYVPSQYLCEFIKRCGYDGVLYRSSVSNGINFAMFDPDKATALSVKIYDITRVSVEVSGGRSPS